MASKTNVSEAASSHQGQGLGNSMSRRGAPAREAGARPCERRRAKVCFISPLGDGLYRPGARRPYGGAELQFFLLSRELAADPDLEIVVLTTVESDPGSERVGEVTLIRRLARGRLARRRTWRPAPWDALSAFWEMYRLLRRVGADVYLHAGAGVEVGAYAVICRLLGRRFVYVVASSADVEQPYGLVRGPLRGLYALGLRLADAVVCRTHDQQAGLLARYGRRGALIRTGHPTGPVPAGRRTTVLWAGRVHPLKQPHLFLDLAERLGGEPCVMAAMRDPRHEELWQSVRRRASVLPNVTRHENVPWRDVGVLFSRAKLLVNTSTYEGFPNTFVEAAMHGTPIVAWMVNPDRVLTEHRIGHCAEGSFERLVADARALCASDGTWTDHSRRARSYAVEHHGITSAARELKSLALSLLASRVSTPDAGGA